MASERGADNIRKYNAGMEHKNLGAVRQELKACRTRKLQFSKPTHLAAYIAERTGIHRTTLGRNPKYRSLLANYLGAQPGAAGHVDDDTDDPKVLKAKLALAQTETGNLGREVRRLRAQLSGSAQPVVNGGSVARSDIDFSNLCMLLTMVLVRAETFALDTKAKSLIDLAAKPSDQVVGGPERASTFIAWVARNRSDPYVARLLAQG